MSELPDGWAECRLTDVLEPVRGIFDGPFGSSLKTSDYVDERDDAVRVVRLENLSTFDFIESKRTWISAEKFGSLRKHEVKAGDVIVGSFVDDRIRVCILPELGRPAIAKADCFCLRPLDSIIERRFLMYQLGLDATRHALISEIHGATRPRVTTKQLRDLPLKLPPLAEQRRIVEKVEALLGAVASASERVKYVQVNAKATKEAAIWGLTDLEDTPRIPLSKLGRWLSGGTPAKDRAEFWSGGELPWVSPKDMKRDFLSDSQDHLTKLAIDSGAGRLIPTGCVLMVVRGMILAHSFPVAVNRVPVAINQDIRALVPASGVEADFVLRCLQARRIEVLERVKESTHGTRRLESDDLFAIQIPLPEPEIQRNVAERIGEVLEKTDRVEGRVTSIRRRMDLVKRSVLAKAFTGELVPTEAELARRDARNYEPATALLERIRVGREQSRSLAPQPRRTSTTPVRRPAGSPQR
jgi:type I restriction enzyme, S subunit